MLNRALELPVVLERSAVVRAGRTERASNCPAEDSHRLLTQGCTRGQGRGMCLDLTGAHLQPVLVRTWRGDIQMNSSCKTALALVVLQSAMRAQPVETSPHVLEAHIRQT